MHSTGFTDNDTAPIFCYDCYGRRVIKVSEFYEFPRYERISRRRRVGPALVLVALFAALFGAFAGAYLGPAYLYGKLLPYPPGYGYAQNYQLPALTPLDGQTYADLVAAGAVAQVAKKVGPAVVGIINRAEVSSLFGTYQQESTGSGIIFDKSGLIVTNQHVISKAREIIVTLSDTVSAKAELIGADERTDLAVVRIDVNELPEEYRDLPVAQFGDSSRLVVGELAVAIGNPLGMQFQRTVTAGIISAVERTLTLDEHRFKVIQTDAAINSGNSGGALADAAGDIIGINQAKIGMSGVEGMGFAIPINVARPIIEDLVSHGKVNRPWLGIQGVAVTPQLAAEYNLPVSEGIYIQVVAGGPAQKAGLRDRDIIIRYDGVMLTDFDQLRDMIAATGVGGIASLEIRRGNNTLTVQVKLGAMP
jgi:serine protease Do